MSPGGRRAELAARAAAVTGAAGSRTDQPQARADHQAGSEVDQAAPVADGAIGRSAPDAESETPAESGAEIRGVGSGAAIPHPQAPARAPRTRPVRVTVELSPMEHRALRRWCAETSAELDLPVVAGAEVFRALLGLMQARPEVADQVRAELARTGGSRRRN